MAALAVTAVAAAFVGTVDVLPAFAALPLPAAVAAFGLYALVQALEACRYRTVPRRLAALAPAASLVLVADHALATGEAGTWPFRLAASGRGRRPLPHPAAASSAPPPPRCRRKRDPHDDAVHARVRCRADRRDRQEKPMSEPHYQEHPLDNRLTVDHEAMRRLILSRFEDDVLLRGTVEGWLDDVAAPDEGVDIETEPPPLCECPCETCKDCPDKTEKAAAADTQLMEVELVPGFRFKTLLSFMPRSKRRKNR